MQSNNNKSGALLSVVIPAHNEAGNLPNTLQGITGVLETEAIPFEIIVIDDHSTDKTAETINRISEKDSRVKLVKNIYAPGYGYTVRRGLEFARGEAVVIVMADSSDDPSDIIKYYKKILEGFECVFGTRFCRQARVINYPRHKFLLNRIGNLFIQILFWLPYNDVTNAFKCYSRKAIAGMQPLISCHFNLTVQMPLKTIVRGYRWCVVPTNWYGRIKGVSKWNIGEMGSRYLFIILYLWLERSLSRKDYYRGTA
ncbi:MAG: glycosyltransferase family 2 protein [Candidatus Omnitrophica bacterium]|nr:glycosyltransferase family 2 protein [Candidatus Omnitrophota bacterium]